MKNTRLEKFLESTLQALIYGIYVYHKQTTKTFRDFLISVKKSAEHMPTEIFNVVKHYPLNKLSENEKIYLVGNVSRTFGLLSEEDRNNKQLAIAAITAYGSSYINVSKELKSDLDVLYLAVIKSQGKRFYPWSSEESCDWFQDVGVQVFDDKNFLSLCISKNRYFCEVLPTQFYQDKDRVLGMLKKLHEDDEKNLEEISSLILKKLPEELLMDFQFLEEYLALTSSFNVSKNGVLWNTDTLLLDVKNDYYVKPGMFDYWGDRLIKLLKESEAKKVESLLENKEVVNLILNKDLALLENLSFNALRDIAFDRIASLEDEQLKKRVSQKYVFEAFIRGNGLEKLSKDEFLNFINERNFEREFTKYQSKYFGHWEQKDLGACFSRKGKDNYPQGYEDFINFFKDMLYANGINRVNLLYKINYLKYDIEGENLGWSGILREADKNGLSMDFRKEVVSNLFIQKVFNEFVHNQTLNIANLNQVDEMMKSLRVEFFNHLITPNMSVEQKRDFCVYYKEKLIESGERIDEIKGKFLQLEIDFMSDKEIWESWRNFRKDSENDGNYIHVYRHELEKRKVLGNYLESLNVSKKEDVLFLEKEFTNIRRVYIKYIPKSFKESDYLFEKIIKKDSLENKQVELEFFIDKVVQDETLLLNLSQLKNYTDIEKMAGSALKKKHNDKEFWLKFLSEDVLFKAEKAIPKKLRNSEFIKELIDFDSSRLPNAWNNVIENKWLDKQEIKNVWLSNVQTQECLRKINTLKETLFMVNINVLKRYPDDADILNHTLENLQHSPLLEEGGFVFQMVVKNIGTKVLSLEDKDFFNILEKLSKFKFYEDQEGCASLQVLMGNKSFAELFEKTYGSASIMEVVNEDKNVLKKILIKYDEKNMISDLVEINGVETVRAKKPNKF